jgi:hypothetical protein
MPVGWTYRSTWPALRRCGGSVPGTAIPPLHVLIDEDGRILALARGAGRPTIARIADQARRRLAELDPLDHTRFAHAVPRPPAHAVWLGSVLGASNECALANPPGM